MNAMYVRLPSRSAGLGASTTLADSTSHTYGPGGPQDSDSAHSGLAHVPGAAVAHTGSHAHVYRDPSKAWALSGASTSPQVLEATKGRPPPGAPATPTRPVTTTP